MRVFAYCTRSAADAVRAATGVEPLTSPPVVAARFASRWLEGQDVLYFRLHGIPGYLGWYGDDGQLALTEGLIEKAHLGGAAVVVANCYSGDDDPMIGALYRAGAGIVVAGAGENIAAGNRVVGADLLMQWIRRGLRAGLQMRAALRIARARLAWTGWRQSDRDARAFRVIERWEVEDEQAKVV